MKTLKLLPLLFLFGIICSSCTKEEKEPEPEITINDFVGSWKASSASFTNNANPDEQFDFIENGGEIRFTMLAGGGVRQWIDIGTFSDEWDAQAELKENNTIVTTPVELIRPTRTNTYEFNGEILTLTNVNTSFDFTLLGNPEVSATSVVVYEKQ